MNEFSPDYVTARGRYREAVAACGGRLDSLPLTAAGPSGEDLAIDIGWFGSETPRRVFIHSSGVHGVEGFAGSAVQLAWLHHGIPSLGNDDAVVVVHVLNPYGMAWPRRFNENNVDLNRNFLGPAEKHAGAPEIYRRIDGFLNPRTPPSNDFFYARVGLLAARYGRAELGQAVAGGQYEFPRGLFFGGKHLEEGPSRFQSYVANRVANVERMVAIDVHTGLGRFAGDQLLVNFGQPEGVYQAMAAAYGERLQPAIKTGMAYESRGDPGGMYSRLCPAATIYFATEEFGTYPSVRILQALRAENRGHHFGSGGINHAAKKRLREMFSPLDEGWQRQVVEHGLHVIEKSLALAFGQ